MAPPAGTLRVGRYFLALLAMIAVLYSIVFWPGQRHTPKLGLDLVGGTQVIFTAKTPNGKAPSSSQMTQAKTIMENRVNGTGVTQSTVVVQGNNQIVVSIPGGTSTDVAALGKAAVLSMRGNVMPAQVVTCSSAPAPSTSASASTSPAAATTPSSSPAAGKVAHARPLTAPTTTPTTPASATAAKTTPAGSASATPPSTPTTPAAVPCVSDPLSGLKLTVPTTQDEYNKLAAADQQQVQAALSRTDCATTSAQSDKAPYYIACETSGGASIAYLLGPVIVAGTQISSATAAAPNVSQGQTQWTVQLNMKSSGQAAWANYTGAHNIGGSSAQASSATQCGPSTTPCADYVGFVLDGGIISAPVNQSAINGQTTEISGNFTQSSANQLANQLKYGALPLSFTPQDAQTVSATLGTSQLKAGLLAGGIGLILVVIYSLIYYRALGFVTIASLLVSGTLTYGCLVMLGTQIGFTLSLAGIAGFIVAVGITADSFVVFFERIKDEVHEGRSAKVAIPRAWVRARRTILSADTVSFLAAAILYYFAAGDVKGFAFTLGLSTILDLVTVFLFTHPLISVLSRSAAFGSSRFTGLDAIRGGTAVADLPTEARSRTAKPKRVRSQPAAPRSEAVSLDKTAVSVLDAELDDDAGTADVDAAEPEGVESESDESGSGERRHSTPAPGTAAERAAARRARMRAEKGQK